MNNRDPFNLRRSNPAFAILKPAANLAARSANTIQEQLQKHIIPHLETIDQESEQELEDSNFHSPAAGGMSYAFPQSSSSSTAELPRSRENTTWQQRRVPHAEQNGVSEKVTNMFKSKGELPMYKDKPYNYSTSQKRSPRTVRRRVALVFLGILLFVLYWTQYLHPPSMKSQSPSSGFFSKTDYGAVKWNERKDKVRQAFKISWKAYEDHAWGSDEFHPISKQGRNMVPNGMGWIIVDALDTMMIMNLTDELTHARDWIQTALSYDQDHDVNTFETTIRMLGGLLSAHYLSTTFPDMAPIPVVEGSVGEDLYLEKATDLADRLLGAYESRSGVPYASINLKTSKGIVSHEDGGASSTAEAASLQLEMKYLAKLTGEKHYWDAAEKVIQVIDDNGMKDGLLPIFIYADQGIFRGNNIRLGSRGDSYYEYLIKQYHQTSNEEPIYLDMWNEALMGVRKHLLTYSLKGNLTILAERPNGLDQKLIPKMDHLVCFMPGTIALGATGGLPVAQARRNPLWGARQEADMALAYELMKTCMGMYKVTATGLSPEIAHFLTHEPPIMVQDEVRESASLTDDANAPWRDDFVIHTQDYHNLQRPETVESLFYMWRITGDERYREWGWQMFEAFMEHTAVEHEGGYTSLDGVDQIPPPKRDNMESFWLAETLKYFYLLFSPSSVLPLDKIVLNTEAHPFPRFTLGKLFSTGWKRKPRDANGELVVANEEGVPSGEDHAGRRKEKEKEKVGEAERGTRMATGTGTGTGTGKVERKGAAEVEMEVEMEVEEHDVDAEETKTAQTQTQTHKRVPTTEKNEKEHEQGHEQEQEHEHEQQGEPPDPQTGSDLVP